MLYLLLALFILSHVGIIHRKEINSVISTVKEKNGKQEWIVHRDIGVTGIKIHRSRANDAIIGNLVGLNGKTLITDTPHNDLKPSDKEQNAPKVPCPHMADRLRCYQILEEINYLEGTAAELRELCMIYTQHVMPCVRVADLTHEHKRTKSQLMEEIYYLI